MIPSSLPFWIRYAANSVAQPMWLENHSWLSAPERNELKHFSNAARRRQWLTARWLCKQVVMQKYSDIDLQQIEILSRNERALGTRPAVSVAGKQNGWVLSIAHNDKGVLVAGTDRRALLGIDLVEHIPKASAFGKLWFSTSEQEWVDEDSQLRTPLLWAIKEAIYKAVNVDEPWAPRQIELQPPVHFNSSFSATYFGKSVEIECLRQFYVEGGLAVIVVLADGTSSSKSSRSQQSRHVATHKMRALTLDTIPRLAQQLNSQTSHHTVRGN
ncbi:MAG: phosphopantetheinyl transferase [Pirellulaceae bacterium]|jgi:phosphopantetheinyl transferase